MATFLLNRLATTNMLSSKLLLVFLLSWARHSGLRNIRSHNCFIVFRQPRDQVTGFKNIQPIRHWCPQSLTFSISASKASIRSWGCYLGSQTIFFPAISSYSRGAFCLGQTLPGSPGMCRSTRNVFCARDTQKGCGCSCVHCSPGPV